VREVEDALARWRNAERRFQGTVPGSAERAKAEAECNHAQAVYERVVRNAAARAAERTTDTRRAVPQDVGPAAD
jgi:hypothetical protein